jgi:hypothetical protein
MWVRLMHLDFRLEISKGEDYLGDPGVEGRILLKSVVL